MGARGTGFKFIKIFVSVPKNDSHDFLLGFKQRGKFSIGAFTPYRDTIGNNFQIKYGIYLYAGFQGLTQ